MQHGETLPPFGSATTACTSDSARLHRLRSNGDVSVVQTRRTPELFISFRINSLHGMRRKPRGPNLFRTTCGSNSDLCGKLCAPMEKNCTVLRPWAGRSSTLRRHSRWRGSIDSAPNGCSLRGESPETRLLDCPRLPIEGKSAARRSGYGPKA